MEIGRRSSSMEFGGDTFGIGTTKERFNFSGKFPVALRNYIYQTIKAQVRKQKSSILCLGCRQDPAGRIRTLPVTCEPNPGGK
jgi:hypothetical protein